MTRHGRRGTEGGRGEWLASDYDGEPRRADARSQYRAAAWDNVAPGDSRRAHGAVGTSSDPHLARWDQTGPPWDLPGWDDEDQVATGGHPSVPLPPGRGEDLASGHPSAPLPRVSGSPSSPGPAPAVPGEPGDPLPPLPPAGHARGEEPYPGGDRAGYGGGGDGGRHRGRHGQGGYPPGDYQPGGFQDAGYQEPGSGYAGPGDGYEDYPSGAGYSGGDGGYPDAAGYPGGEYPAGTGYADPAGYPGEDGYPGGEGHGPGYEGGAEYPEAGGYPGYPDDEGYAAAGDYPPGDDAYPGYQEAAGGHAARHAGGQPGYDAAGDWYEDVDDEQAWAEEDDGERFLPGLGDGAGAGRGRAPSRAPRAGGARGRPAPGRGGRGGKRKKGVRRAAPWVAVGVLIFALCAAGGGYYYVWRTYLHPPDYSGPGTGSVEVTITNGETAAAVGRMLAAKGVVASERAFYNAAKASGHGSALEPGTFKLRLHMKAALAFQLLLSPAARVQTKATVPDGLRVNEIIAALGKATGNLKGYQQAIKETSKLGLPSYANGNPEGYLYPDTYSVEPGTPPLKVLQEMVAAFNHEAANINLPAAAAHGNLTPGQVITVASLLEAEGGKVSDYPKIAEVIYNRLNQHIDLQLDSTVLFALHKRSVYVSDAETRVKSPYNTYLHRGLPPGPIDSPGAAAIHAALHPDYGGLLYFVTVNPKTKLTKFTNDPNVFARYKQELMNYLSKHHGG